MAATMKHRRSSSKKRSTRAADRYDAQLKKFKKIKKYGGLPVVKVAGKKVALVSHRVTKQNPIYRGVKVIATKSTK